MIAPAKCSNRMGSPFSGSNQGGGLSAMDGTGSIIRYYLWAPDYLLFWAHRSSLALASNRFVATTKASSTRADAALKDGRYLDETTCRRCSALLPAGSPFAQTARPAPVMGDPPAKSSVVRRSSPTRAELAAYKRGTAQALPAAVGQPAARGRSRFARRPRGVILRLPNPLPRERQRR